MSLLQFSGLLVVYLFSLGFILTLTGANLNGCVLISTCSLPCCFADLLLWLSADQRPGIPL